MQEHRYQGAIMQERHVSNSYKQHVLKFCLWFPYKYFDVMKFLVVYDYVNQWK